MRKETEVLAPLLLRHVYSITCSSPSHVARRNFCAKPGGPGRPATNFEPYKATMLRKYLSGSTVKDLRLWLLQNNVQVSDTTIAHRLGEWGGYKTSVLIPHREALIDMVRQGVPYRQFQGRLEEQGLFASMRTVHACMAEWNVIKRPRGPRLKKLKIRIKRLCEEGLKDQDILNILHREYCFVTQSALKRYRREIEQGKIAFEEGDA